MNEPQQVGDLEIEHDMQFVQRSWMLQRVGRTLGLLLIIAALLGAFGHGWLASDRAVTSDGKLSVEYERIAHFQTPCRMQIHVAAEAFAGEELRLWIDRGFIDDATLRMVSPEPVHMETSGERLIYAFRSPESSEDARITIDLETEKFGSQEIELGLVDGPQLKLSQFILP